MDDLWSEFLPKQRATERKLDQCMVKIATFSRLHTKYAAEMLDCSLSLAGMTERLIWDNKDEEMNVFLAVSVVSQMESYTEKLEAVLERWEALERISKLEIAELMLLIAKLGTLTEWIGYAFRIPLDDLFCVQKTDSRWERLKRLVMIVDPEKPEELELGIRQMEEGVLFGNAVISKGFEYKHPTTKEVMVGLSVFLFRLSHRKMRAQAMINYAKPTLESTLALWNSTDSVLVAPIYERGIAKIAVRAMIYIPRTVEPVFPYAHSYPIDASKAGKFYSQPKP